MSLLKLLGRLVLGLSVAEDEEATVVDSTNQEENLQPPQCRDGLNGSDTVGNGLKSNTRRDFSRELEDLRDDVTNDSELGNAAVLKLSGAIVSKCLSINVGRKTYI